MLDEKQGWKMSIFKVAIASPMYNSLDYLGPLDGQQVLPGMRVRVPFGRQKLLGVVMACAENSEIPQEKLKAIAEVLDERPLLSKALLALCQKASDYYHYPLGELVLKTLPRIIRLGKPIHISPLDYFQLSEAGLAVDFSLPSRAKKQMALMCELREGSLTWTEIKQRGFGKMHLDALISKAWVEKSPLPETELKSASVAKTAFELNPAQENAIHSIINTKHFQTFLLQGVTGSGKTEVYLQVIAKTLERHQQALVLVPEIALTPQTVERFHRRFPNASIAVLHSGLSGSERANAWAKAALGVADIIIGTRSAIFIPLPRPGIIILDEEHDSSFKQQSGFRYSARDLSVLRGNLENIPIILGSATPALESIHNVKLNKYQRIELPERAGLAKVPSVGIIDLRLQKPGDVLSEPLLSKIRAHLDNKGQVLLFLNRRGYAPILMCHQCGDVVKCHACDSKMVLHQSPRKLICHHCGAAKNPPKICEHCRRADLFPMGLGTERLEEILQAHFPTHPILRIDRDTIKNKPQLDLALAKIHEKKVDILVGTQMLAKGHHFPALSLVAIVDSDSGFFSADFRGLEKMAQAIVQVAGRAGREEQIGEVLIQTHHPRHPLLNVLLKEGYSAFAEEVLKDREKTRLPPFSHMALLRAEGANREFPIRYLTDLKSALQKNIIAHVDCWGPIPATMERKSGRYRYHLLFQSAHRGNLQKMLAQVRQTLNERKSSKVRWVLDVDPQEVI